MAIKNDREHFDERKIPRFRKAAEEVHGGLFDKKMKPNEGEVPQYYIEESHEAIIDPAEWDAVQDEMERRKAIGKAYSGKSVLSAKIICGDCGAWYGSKVWHSTDKYKSVVWQCNAKFADGKKRCTTPHISEEEIKRRFLAAYNSLITDKKGGDRGLH